MNAIRQLNSGGLKLKSNFSAKSVAANVAANRGSAAAMVKNSNYTFGSNLLFTPARRIGGTPRYASSSALSRALNGQNMRFVSGGGIPAYSGVNYKQNFTMGTSNAFNAGMGVGSMINLGLSALKQLSDMGIIGGKKDVTPQGAGDALLDKTNLSNLATTVTGNFTSSLSGAKSFAEVNKIENEIAQKKANLNTDYKGVGTKATANVDEILGGEGVSDGMKLAGVDIDKSAFELSELKPEDLEGSAKTIDKDITKIGDFKTKDLTQAKAKISEKSGQISGTLTVKKGELERSKADLATLQSTNKDGCNDTKIAELQKQIDKLEQEEIPKLEDQKKQIEAAEKAVDQISTEAQNTIDSLKAKKTEIEDMKKAEDGMKDKKYDLAKSQDEELGKAMQKLEKLNKEIDELSKADKSPDKYDKKDEARANKLNGLIAQRSGLYSQLSQLVSSLSAAGDTTFKNSKNQSYTIKNLEKANNMLSSKPADPAPASIRTTTTNTPSSVSTGNELSEITNLGTTHARLTEADLKGKSPDELASLMDKYNNSNDPSGAMRALIAKAMEQE
ncbi:hypothetical protein IJ674_05960 [bacterium]|nr:hypothetical protein [bacterium]